jgi:hypothetical protein
MVSRSGKGSRSIGSGKEESTVFMVEDREDIVCGRGEFCIKLSALMDERMLYSF